MIRIQVPQNLNLINSLAFCARLWELDLTDEYRFDFSRLSHVEPFTMAYVANELKRFSESKPDCKCLAEDFEDKTYPAHMGFFKAFGLDFGNDPGQASGSSTYLPLTILDVSEIKKKAVRDFSHVGDVIEQKSSEIAKILTQQHKGDLVDTLTFAIREIMRNVVEHSDSEVIEYCAQYWPTRRIVEVAIIDTGIGIREALSKNPYLEMNDERDALHLALMPGISGKMFKGVKRRSNDSWQNSGFGLYMISRICRNGGDFFVASNNKSIILDSESKNEIECNHKGTALRMRINTGQIGSYSKILEKYRNEGYKAAKRFSGKDAIEPSVASTMLARDFTEL